MTGNVYSLPISDGGESKPHPHVVALELQRELLLIPAFSEGGAYIEAKVQAAARLLTVNPDLVGIRLDNAACVRFFDGRAGNRAVWLLVKRSKVERRYVSSRTPVGRMSDSGLLALVEGLIELSTHDKSVSPSLLKKLRQLARDLKPPPADAQR